MENQFGSVLMVHTSPAAMVGSGTSSPCHPIFGNVMGPVMTMCGHTGSSDSDSIAAVAKSAALNVLMAGRLRHHVSSDRSVAGSLS